MPAPRDGRPSRKSPRVRRDPGVVPGLEVLLRASGDAGVLEQLAEQGAAAALRGADQIGPRHVSHPAHPATPRGFVAQRGRRRWSRSRCGSRRAPAARTASIDPGEALDLPRARPGVEALGVATGALVDIGVDVDLDERQPGSLVQLCAGRSRSERRGETSETTATTPASANRRATWPTRRTFSARSPGAKPRSSESPWRMLSPSSRYAARPLETAAGVRAQRRSSTCPRPEGRSARRWRRSAPATASAARDRAPTGAR